MPFNDDFDYRMKIDPDRYWAQNGDNRTIAHKTPTHKAVFGNFGKGIKSFCQRIFANPGKTLKWFATVDFFVAILVGIGGAVSIICDKWGWSRFWSEYIWQAIGCCIAGYCGGYVTSIPIYAFGSFVEDTAESKAILNGIAQQLKQINCHIDNTSKCIENEKQTEGCEE